MSIIVAHIMHLHFVNCIPRLQLSCYYADVCIDRRPIIVIVSSVLVVHLLIVNSPRHILFDLKLTTPAHYR